MDRAIQYFQDRTDIWIIRSNISRTEENRKIWFPYNLIFPEIRVSWCHGLIRLIKTVCLNQFSDFIIVKNGPKSNFYIKFVEKKRQKRGNSRWKWCVHFLNHFSHDRVRNHHAYCSRIACRTVSDHTNTRVMNTGAIAETLRERNETARRRPRQHMHRFDR